MDDNQDPLRILVLDGGDLRVVSQMVILEELMSRVAWDWKEDTILPCNYFHLIVGVGAGGLLAMLLGILDMSVGAALDEFISIHKLVLDDPNLIPAMRSENLEVAMIDLLKRRGFSPDQSLLGTGKCHTTLCSASTSNLNICRTFRNRKVRGPSQDVTILEAVRATWASPGLYTPIFVGPPNYQEEFVGGDCAFSNPTKQAMQEANHVLCFTRQIGSIISLGFSMPRAVSFAPNPADSDLRLSDKVAFFDTERVAIEIRDLLRETGVYHRYAVQSTQDPLYSLHSDAVARIVGETKSFISLADSQLNECIMEPLSHTNVTLRDLYPLLWYQPHQINPPKWAGVPPLSTYFVPRADVMAEMNRAFFSLDEASLKIMVVTGMGGSGKTQIVSNFLRVHKDLFPQVLFINASSTRTIEAELMKIGQEKRLQNTTKTPSDVLSILFQSSIRYGRLAIVYDGADDPDVDMARFLPSRDNGTIFITTRNQNLQLLSPLGTVKLDAMSTDDATSLLLKTALPLKKSHSNSDQARARAIVEELGCLAIAVNQAGCHIQMQGGIENYLDRLRSSRASILRRPIGTQRTEGHRSVYAALDVTLPALSQHVLGMLSILCFLGSSPIPLDALFRAFRYRFAKQPAHLLPRLSEYEVAIQRLCDIFIPADAPDEERIWELLDELQRYSLVKQSHLVSPLLLGNPASLQFHKLVFAWAKDRLPHNESTQYQSQAVRLLSCCTAEEDKDLFGSLFPHVQTLSSIWNIVHVNDLVGFSNVIRHRGEIDDLQRLCSGIYEEVLQECGSEHLQTSEAALYLADAYSRNGQFGMATSLVDESVTFRIQTFGHGHLETMNALAHQALGLYRQGQLNEAESLQREILLFRQMNAKDDIMRLVQSMEELVETIMAKSSSSFSRPVDAYQLIHSALKIWTGSFGDDHWRSHRLRRCAAEVEARMGVCRQDRILEEPFFRECISILGRSMKYLFAAESLGVIRWNDLVDEQLQKQQLDPQQIQKIESLASDLFWLGRKESLIQATLLTTLVLDMHTRMAQDLNTKATISLEDLDYIAPTVLDYHGEVTKWSTRHKCNVDIGFAAAGADSSPHYICFYTLDCIRECAGEWKPTMSQAQQSAAKEVFKALQHWSPST